MRNANCKIFTLAAAKAVILLGGNVLAAGSAQLSDLDNDGIISAEEIIQARATARAAMLEQFDTNADGKLSGEERGAARDVRDAQMLDQYDVDGDGQLSHAERGAARDAHRMATESALDVNGDGQLSDEERAGFEEIREERGYHRKDDGGKRHGGKHDKERAPAQG